MPTELAAAALRMQSSALMLVPTTVCIDAQIAPADTSSRVYGAGGAGGADGGGGDGGALGGDTGGGGDGGASGGGGGGGGDGGE